MPKLPKVIPLSEYIQSVEKINSTNILAFVTEMNRTVDMIDLYKAKSIRSQFNVTAIEKTKEHAIVTVELKENSYKTFNKALSYYFAYPMSIYSETEKRTYSSAYIKKNSDKFKNAIVTDIKSSLLIDGINIKI